MFQQSYIYESLYIQEKEAGTKKCCFDLLRPHLYHKVSQTSWEEKGFAYFFCLWTACFLVALNILSSGKLLNVRVQQWLTLIYEIPQNFHCDSVSHVNVASSAVTQGSSICVFRCSFSVMVWGLLEAKLGFLSKLRTWSPSVLVLCKLLVKRVH